jgi:hypothetical protein
MALAPKTASAPTTVPILFDCAILRCNMLPSGSASSLELARGILSERLAYRLGLTQFEAVHADFEHRAAFLYSDAAPGRDDGDCTHRLTSKVDHPEYHRCDPADAAT